MPPFSHDAKTRMRRSFNKRMALELLHNVESIKNQNKEIFIIEILKQ